ncbi:unnamed protein product [Paramecium primaurelia]|uniref:Uncharacterized protein n=1 Tax=Paramecium primaurelia TaxID=5886 RepID=A0A8S1N1B7_PARPR|nr:unnamed protein product [Paramecium primaurelia]
MLISNTTQSKSRNSVTHTILTGSNSIIYSLHKYKRSSLKNKNCNKNEDDFVQTKLTQLRRKSCCCNECGQLSNFQFKQLNNNASIRQNNIYMNTTSICQSVKLINSSHRQSVLFQRHHSRMNTYGETQLSQVYNLTPTRLSPIKSKQDSQNKLRYYLQNKTIQQTKRNRQFQLNLITVHQCHKDQEQQLINKVVVKSPLTQRKSKPDVRPYLSHLKLKPICTKNQVTHFEI